MSKISYTGLASFADKDFKGAAVPVNSFEVAGGAKRIIDLDSKAEMNIASEMEDAKTFKNLTLFLSSADGLAAARLEEAFAGRKQLRIFFRVEVFSGPTMTKAFTLISEAATVKKHPSAAGDKKLLKVELSVPDAKLGQISQKSEKSGQLFRVKIYAEQIRISLNEVDA